MAAWFGGYLTHHPCSIAIAVMRLYRPKACGIELATRRQAWREGERRIGVSEKNIARTWSASSGLRGPEGWRRPRRRSGKDQPRAPRHGIDRFTESAASSHSPPRACAAVPPGVSRRRVQPKVHRTSNHTPRRAERTSGPVDRSRRGARYGLRGLPPSFRGRLSPQWRAIGAGDAGTGPGGTGAAGTERGSGPELGGAA